MEHIVNILPGKHSAEPGKKELRKLEQPPDDKKSYVIPQFEGEVLSIPGSKSVFRIMTSALQTDDTIAVFTSGGALADAPGFHHHEEAHDVFLVTKGHVKLWNGDKCKIMGPGDFGYVPPHIIHNPQLLGPATETFGLITPASWLNFFRYVAEKYDGILYPEFDDRNLKEILIPKIMAAKGQFDVHFHPHHEGCAVSEWDADDEKLPNGSLPYYLRANTGPRWLLGGVLSRPFITTRQSAGKFAISSIESSSRYGSSVFDNKMTFPSVHHCLSIVEGALEVTVEDLTPCVLREGETIFIAAGTPFALKFASKFVRVWSFTSGDGIEAFVHEAGEPWKGYAIPDSAGAVDEAALEKVREKLGVKL
ncbi:cupin domain protein [Phyllosticta citriasiana]|uniref:cupin domain protein n=1 Tax=Phyllosticta citriasiana TaxID=595635 RepID=UPI0030FD60E6